MRDPRRRQRHRARRLGPRPSGARRPAQCLPGPRALRRPPVPVRRRAYLGAEAARAVRALRRRDPRARRRPRSSSSPTRAATRSTSAPRPGRRRRPPGDPRIDVPAARLGGPDDRRDGDARGRDAGRGQGPGQLGAARRAGDADGRRRRCRDQLQEAAAEVLAQEEEHHAWAHDTRARTVLSLPASQRLRSRHADTRGGGPRALSRDELYAQAQEHGHRGPLADDQGRAATVTAVGATAGRRPSMNPLDAEGHRRRGPAPQLVRAERRALRQARRPSLHPHPGDLDERDRGRVDHVLATSSPGTPTTSEIKRALALSRRIDAQQQKVVNGLNPGDQTPLETTIGYEQVAVDLTAWLARHEPDPMLKQALDFALLEDFDHLYRYANLYDLLDGKDASELTEQPDRDHAGPTDRRRAPPSPRRRQRPLRDPHRATRCRGCT